MMPIQIPPPIPLPPAFPLKKSKILSSLAAPSETYTDLSPKGCVDDGIRDLIQRINSLDGVVTTSSCAGRVSVFLEGRRSKTASSVVDARDDEDEGQEEGGRRGGRGASDGGKGRGGRWLFVSHEPVSVPVEGGLKRVLGIEKEDENENENGKNNNNEDEKEKDDELDIRRTRFIRFQFEPMVSFFP
jgi:tRNA wybutosine-synthesizing protein 3